MKNKTTTQRVGGKHKENHLQKARTKAGITQEQAADDIDCGIRTLQRYESGERQPSLVQLQRIQQCYNCAVTDLFPDTKEDV